MTNSYDLLFLVCVYIFSAVALLVLIISGITLVIEKIKNKKIIHKTTKFSIFAISFICFYLTLCWWFLAIAMNCKNPQDAEIYHNLSVKTAIIPSVKKYMYYNEGSFYEITHNGEKAIRSFNKATSNIDPQICNIDTYKENKNCKDYMFSSYLRLCDLYTIKGETEKGITICNNIGLYNMVVVNYILKKDYTTAFNQINENITRMEKTTKKQDGLSYAIRGNIYEHLGEYQKAQQDYQKAQKLSKNKKIKQIKNNKNYYEDFFNLKRIEYGF